MSITTLIALGNPGLEYQKTRHNVGFMVIDHLAASLGASWTLLKKQKALVAKVAIEGKPILLVKPSRYMNESGLSVQSVCGYYKIPPNEVAIIYDDITVGLGATKLSEQPGTAGHNGAASVLKEIGPGFVRYRIGIGGKQHSDMELTDHVLSRFTEAETATINQRLPKIIEELHLLIDKGTTLAMNSVNQSS